MDFPSSLSHLLSTSLLCDHFRATVPCFTANMETMPSSSLRCMLSSDPDPRAGLPAVLFCFWYQDILNTPSHSSSCHFTNPSDLFRSYHLPSYLPDSPKRIPFRLHLASIAFDFPVSYMLDLNGGLDHIPLVFKMNFLNLLRTQEDCKFLYLISSCPSPCSPGGDSFLLG